MITAGNILVHEFIGLRVGIARCADRKLEGFGGVVVDETRNTLRVSCGGKERTVVKNGCVLRFTLPAGGSVDVDGSIVSLDPAERPKRLARLCKVV